MAQAFSIPTLSTGISRFLSATGAETHKAKSPQSRSKPFTLNLEENYIKSPNVKTLDGGCPQELKLFTFMPKLPPEIRCVIWTYAIANQGCLAFTVSIIGRHQAFLSNRPVPVALHINRESRLMALKVYTLVNTTMQVLG